MKNKAFFPLGLTTLRLALGPVALYCAGAALPRIWFLPLMITALFSDIYDGVLARHFGVASPQLRRYDSATDIIFYIFILIATALIAPTLIAANWIWIALALSAEAACIAMALLKFRRLASAHSYLAKFFGLALFAGLTTILCIGGPEWIVPSLCAICVLVNAEILLMMFLANRPPVDVLSVWPMLRKKISSRPIKAALPKTPA